MKFAPMSVLALVLAASCPSDAWSYSLSPCYRVLSYQGGVPREEPVRKRGSLCAAVMKPEERSAVHEHMSAAALREYRAGPGAGALRDGWKWQYMVEDPWTKQGGPHQSLAIVFGTWWNDDPLMRTLGQSVIFMKGGLKAHAVLSKNWPKGDDGRTDCGIHLDCASHLGKLQHLHFMTDDPAAEQAGQAARVDATVEKALGWMAFAYEVATGELAPDAPLDAALEARVGLPSIALNHGVQPANAKIRTLFARQGQDLATRNARTPDVALGSMLHILQDSFSPAHTCRVEAEVGGKRMALLRAVENYGPQYKKVHTALDQHPRWMLEYLKLGQHRYDNDPVKVGAWLIDAVDRKLPWQQVEAQLRTSIFATAPASDSAEAVCIERNGARLRPDA